jgi:hypothetical protein
LTGSSGIDLPEKLRSTGKESTCKKSIDLQQKKRKRQWPPQSQCGTMAALLSNNQFYSSSPRGADFYSTEILHEHY